MARGRKARAECKCGTIMGIGEAIDDVFVKMVCTNCGFTKEVRLEKVPDICRKQIVDAVIQEEDVVCEAEREPQEEKTIVELAI